MNSQQQNYTTATMAGTVFSFDAQTQEYVFRSSAQSRWIISKPFSAVDESRGGSPFLDELRVGRIVRLSIMNYPLHGVDIMIEQQRPLSFPVIAGTLRRLFNVRLAGTPWVEPAPRDHVKDLVDEFLIFRDRNEAMEEVMSFQTCVHEKKQNVAASFLARDGDHAVGARVLGFLLNRNDV